MSSRREHPGRKVKVLSVDPRTAAASQNPGLKQRRGKKEAPVIDVSVGFALTGGGWVASLFTSPRKQQMSPPHPPPHETALLLTATATAAARAHHPRPPPPRLSPRRCQIACPPFMSVAYLEQVLRREREDGAVFTSLPHHYLEIASLLLNTASDDISELRVLVLFRVSAG